MSAPPPSDQPAPDPGYGPVPPAGGQQPAPGYAPPAPKQPRPRGKPAVGIIAFAAAVVGVIGGAVLVGISSWMLGDVTGQYAPPSGQMDPDNVAIPQEVLEGTMVPAFVMGAAGWIVYGLLGLWGLIQGIVAAVTNRGRAWGITAIVVAACGWVVLLILGGVLLTAAAGQHL